MVGLSLGLCFGLLAFCWPYSTHGKVDQLDRELLEFQIVVKYSGKELPIESMGLRGNGLGLSWDTTSPMTQESEGTWTSRMVFRSTRYGYSCDTCDNPAPNLDTGDALLFRAVATDKDGHEHAMKGPAYRIPLPMSRVGQHFSEKPMHTLYPYFLENKGMLTHNAITARDDTVIGQRDIYFYMPPGYGENPKPEYDVIYMFDFGPQMSLMFGPKIEEVTGIFDEAFNKYATDAAIIGFGDYHEDPEAPIYPLNDRYIITPYPGVMLACKEGSMTPWDRCNGCLPLATLTNFTLFHELMAEKCGKPWEYGGKLDDILDYLLDEVHPALSDKIAEEAGSRLTRERERTMITGFSWGGLATCYAAWTRPETFGRAACQSASFHQPDTFVDETFGNGYDFPNKTLKTHLENRPRQQLHIDVGGEEILLPPTTEIASILRANKDFEEDVNFWFQVYEGQAHNSNTHVARMWSMLKIFSIGRN